MTTTNLDVLICVHNRAIPNEKEGRTMIHDKRSELIYKDAVKDVRGITAMELRGQIRNSEPGQITFPKDGISGNVAIGWVVGRGNQIKSVAGQLKKRVEAYNTNTLTPKEMEQRLLDQFDRVSKFWSGQENLTQRQAVEGALHSVLELLHGGDHNPDLPRYRLVPLSNPDSNRHLVREGMQPYPNTEHLEQDPNLLFTGGSPANDFLVKTRGAGEPLGYVAY